MSRRILLIDIGNGLTLTGVLPSVALYGTYSARLIARGGTAPYTFTLASGALPAGVYLDAATGVISGSPTEAGNFTIIVRVTDISGSSVVRAFAVQVIAEPLTLSGAAPDGTVGVAQSHTYAVAGGVPPYTFALVDPPAGWSVPDVTAPTIDYTPASAGAQSWTIRVTDSIGATFDLVDTATFGYPALTVTGAYGPATLGTPYSSDLAIAGGDGTYSNPRVTVGSLAGTGLALSIVGSALRLSGTPTGSAQTLNITVAIDSGDGQTASSAQTVTISAASVSDPYWADVVALLQADGTNGSQAIVDKTGKAWSAFGTARVDTSNAPFAGTNSFRFDSVTAGQNYLKTDATSSDFAFGTGDFTVEAWVDMDATITEYQPIGQPNSANAVSLVAWVQGASSVRFNVYDNGEKCSSVSNLLPQVWHHVAWVRRSGIDHLFVDGVESGTTNASSINYSAAGYSYVGFGQYMNGFKGNIAQYRVTKGIARYTANFTPPNAPFPDH